MKIIWKVKSVFKPNGYDGLEFASRKLCQEWIIRHITINSREWEQYEPLKIEKKN
jgi:hypothetical protein